MKDRTIAVYTLGCKVNQYDTEAMLESFEAEGYRAVPVQEPADVYLINTCTVTGTGDQKSLKMIRRAARQNPACAIVVCGCLAQRDAEMLMSMENVRLVIGVQRQFHLSLQSGSATVLARMRRRYTPEEYRRAVQNLRRYMPDCAITTDVIVGFPGETEQEFQETLDFVTGVGLSRIHVFPYSRRKGTLADSMTDQVDESLKHARAKKLIEIGNKLENAFVLSLIGSVQEVLFEQPAGEGLAEGYTGQYIRVRAQAEPGQILRVRLVEAVGTLAMGESV